MPESVSEAAMTLEAGLADKPDRCGSNPPTPAADALSADVPAISARDAERIARDIFDLSGTARLLSGERDLNFVIVDPAGPSHVLKIANAQEDEGVLASQAVMLEHIAQCAASLPVPRVVRSRDGVALARVGDRTGRMHFASVLTFLEGRPLAAVEPSPGLAAQAGRLLARLGAVMRDVGTPVADRSLLWDLSRAAELTDKLHHVREPELKAGCRLLLDRFAAEDLPVLGRMTRQPIHNDFNPHNLIVGNGSVGVIDFGDMVQAARINDLAIAACYQCAAGEAALGLAPDMVAAYHREQPLAPEEIELLPRLMALRAVQTIIITAWRAALHPQNSAYILRNRPAALATLDRLQRIDAAEASRQLLDGGAVAAGKSSAPLF